MDTTITSEMPYWGKKLNEIARIEYFSTNKELAVIMGCSVPTVCDYRSGKIKKMTSELLKNLNKKGYSYEWLLNDVGEPKTTSSTKKIVENPINNELIKHLQDEITFLRNVVTGLSRVK